MKITRPAMRSFLVLATLFSIVTTLFATGARADDSDSSREQRLLEILRSDAPKSEKAIACKNLAIYGSDDAVPELAKLLSDEQLSSWARIALEVIPGEAASAALRAASDRLDGRLCIGMINSIGVRRDASAVDSLTTRLADSDVEVASAAAVALGRIGNDAATKSLRKALTTAPAKVRSAIAEGCVLSAERLHAEGQSEAAMEIYDEIRTADLPMQRIIEATRGAILVRNQEGIPLLIEAFRSAEEKLFQLALGTAREFPGGEVDKALAAEMVHATPERAALIVQAMADRPDTVVLDAVLKAAETGPKEVRLSAIEALERVGEVSSLTSLLTIASDADSELADAAKETLANLPSQKVNQKIAALLPDAKGDSYTLLLELIGRRRIDAIPEVMKALDHSDAKVRGAALIALGETVSLDQMSVLIAQVVDPKEAEENRIARQALKAASVRMPDREACAAQLAAALQRSSSSTKNDLLEIISEVGGSTSLRILAESAKSGDPQLLDTSSRLLGKWNGVEAAPILLDLAKTATEKKYKVRALRGYLGLARKFASGEKRAEMCQNAIDVAIRPDEQELALTVLTLRPSAPGLAVAKKAQQLTGLKEAALKATQTIAQKIDEKQ